MTDQQLEQLRYIIQEEIEVAINTREAGRFCLREEEEGLDRLWQKFKDSFNGLK